MMFQRLNPFPMSVGDNVVAGVKVHRLAKDKQLDVVVEERLRQVGLWDAVKDRLDESRSGSRVASSSCCAWLGPSPSDRRCSCSTMPTSSLDPGSTEGIEHLIRGLTPGYTSIIVTHNLGQARRLSHHTMFLNGGRLVEHGTTEQVVEIPREPETHRYVAGRFG